MFFCLFKKKEKIINIVVTVTQLHVELGVDYFSLTAFPQVSHSLRITNSLEFI